MPIDSSIYANLRGPDIGGALESGFKMRDMMDARNLKQKQLGEDEAIKQARIANTTTNEDGSTSFNSKGFYGAYNKINPERSLQDQRKEQLSSWEIEKMNNEQIASLAATANDQSSYDRAVETAIARGLAKPGDLPPVFTPDVVKNIYSKALTTVQRLDQMNKDRGLDIRSREKKEVDPVTRELQLSRLDKMKSDQRQRELENRGGANLPLDQKEVVGGLAKKNAAKIAIKNQIDAVMGNWDNLTPDQKIVQGRTLLKTLNSAEGADAIGSEEAKRLGGLLEFKKFNLTEPGSFIGRDVDEFAKQARENSAAIDRAVGTNQSEIDRLMGRGGMSAAAGKTQPPPTSVEMIAPDGSRRMVPQNQVAAAKAAGGKIANQVAGGKR